MKTSTKASSAPHHAATAITREELRTRIAEPARLSDRGLVDALEEIQRLQSTLDERKLTIAAALVDRICDEYRAVGAWSSTALDIAESEIGVALTLNRYNAGRVLGIAMALRNRLPRLRRALADGLIDLHRAHQFNDATCNVPDDLIGEVEQRALAKILPDPSTPRSGLTGKRLTNAIARVVGKVDPEGVRERRARRMAERYVGVGKTDDGMSSLQGSLPAEDALRLDGRLREMAGNPCRHDGRTFDQRRAGSLVALADSAGFLPCRCGRDDCPRRTCSPAAPRKPLVHVVMLAGTLDGTSDEPGFLDGYGTVDAEHARHIARGGTVVPVRMPEDVRARSERARDPRAAPVSAALAAGHGTGSDAGEGATREPPGALPASAFRYRPSTALANWVRVLGGMCRWPHCDAAAWNSDLDHTVPFDHASPETGGTTTADGLKPYCRHHHRLKHSGHWHEQVEADGTVTVVSPAGTAYNSADAGLLDVLGVNAHRTGADAREARKAGSGSPKRRTRTQIRYARVRAERRRHHARAADTASDAAGVADARSGSGTVAFGAADTTAAATGAASSIAAFDDEAPPF